MVAMYVHKRCQELALIGLINGMELIGANKNKMLLKIIMNCINEVVKSSNITFDISSV